VVGQLTREVVAEVLIAIYQIASQNRITQLVLFRVSFRVASVHSGSSRLVSYLARSRRSGW
jgi:hypothetical protein